MTDEPAIEGQEEIESPDQEELSEEEADLAKLKEAVAVEAEDIGTLRKKLTVTVPRDTIDERMQDQFTELKREAQVDGFRRGRAPLRLIQRRFGRDVSSQMTGPLVANSYMAALEKAGLKDRTIGEPRVWVKVPEHKPGEPGTKKTLLVDKLLEPEEAIEYLNLPEDSPFTFTCEVELRPEFELPELSGIPLQRPQVRIDDGMIDAEIDRMRAMRAQYVPVEGGSVQPDDVVVADYRCAVGERVLAQESNRPLGVYDQRLEGIHAAGLADALAGKSLDETTTLEAAVPEDHEDGDLRGQTARFELTIRDIKRRQLPELDEPFLTSLGVDSPEELRKAVADELEFSREQMARQQLRSGIREYLLANTDLEIPAGLSQRQTDRALARRMVELYRMGIPQEDVEKRMDALRASAADEATGDLKLFFVMEKIADELEVAVTEEEVNSAIAGIAQRSGRRFDRVRDELATRGGLESLYVQLRDEKIMDRLIEDARVTETSGPDAGDTADSGAKQQDPSGEYADET